MLFRVQSAAVFGIKAYPVSVEVDLSAGEKLALMTVGLPDTAVRESSERVKAALRRPATNAAAVSSKVFIVVTTSTTSLRSVAPPTPSSGAVHRAGAGGRRRYGRAAGTR